MTPESKGYAPAVRPVRYGVIPAGGLGTRFLPISRAVPKELIPVVDTPVIELVVTEMTASGIDTALKFETQSPDGSTVAYTVFALDKFNTWMVPVLGGEPRLMFPNTEGLTWIDSGRPPFLSGEPANGRSEHVLDSLYDRGRQRSRTLRPLL